MVSSTGGCRHRSGGFPYSCLTELPDCENKCTSLSSCIAYATNETHCALIPSNRLNCSAIDMSSHGSTVANLPYKKGTTNDLIHTSAFTGFNCSKIVIGEMCIYVNNTRCYLMLSNHCFSIMKYFQLVLTIGIIVQSIINKIMGAMTSM